MTFGKLGAQKPQPEAERSKNAMGKRKTPLMSVAISLLAVTAVLWVYIFVTADGEAVAEEPSIPLQPGWTLVNVDKIKVDRPTEPKATYTIIGVAKTADGKVAAVNTRYSDMTGWVYTLRMYDCDKRSLFTLGSGETYQDMLLSRPDPHWGGLVEGSSATQVARIACEMIGKRI
ncbi:MAG: hypothetical protein V7774_08110 [Pseudorhizobium pelagicum]|uniref:hypothetical protein n=1 Tax=Pseudorhizobium pelagicum TaxID=1509405 RepID=UPI0034610CC7